MYVCMHVCIFLLKLAHVGALGFFSSTLHVLPVLAKSLSGGFWRLILRHSGADLPNRSQEASGDSFEAISGADSPNHSQDASGGSF